MTTVLFAEDHKIFNDGLKATLSHSFHVVAQIFDGNDVLPAIAIHKPKIAILDINLPNKNGLDIGKEIKALHPEIKVVFLSMYAESSFIKSAKDLGAHGYFLKDWASTDIIEALKKIEKGETVFSDLLNDKKINLHHDDYFVKQFSLSKREIDVIRYIKEGKSTEDIAAELFLSFETVKSHRKNIYYKLGFSKLTELIQFANDHNI
jgi:DNA-binding NarL/FixJ family response regulator